MWCLDDSQYAQGSPDFAFTEKRFFFILIQWIESSPKACSFLVTVLSYLSSCLKEPEDRSWCLEEELSPQAHSSSWETLSVLFCILFFLLQEKMFPHHLVEHCCPWRIWVFKSSPSWARRLAMSLKTCEDGDGKKRPWTLSQRVSFGGEEWDCLLDCHFHCHCCIGCSGGGASEISRIR